jgi:succinate dehydrogenase hydrophobic anchor subunit
VYDIALLALVTVHGFNGLRYILTDYTMGNPVLRRAMSYLCVIGALVLFWTGGRALLGTIEPTFMEAAEEAARAFLIGS